MTRYLSNRFYVSVLFGICFAP